MKAVDTALRHIGARLRGNPTVMAAVSGRIHEGVAPEDATYPLVLVQVYGDPETIVYNGGAVAHRTLDVTVRVVSHESSVGPLIPIAAAVHTALHDTSGTYPSGTVTSCHETNETVFSELSGGRTYRYLGGRYHLTVS